MTKDPIYLTTDLGHDGYLRVTLNLPQMKDVNVKRDRCSKGRFLFELEETGFEGVTIQVTSNGKLNIYFPQGAPEEAITNRILEVLREANGDPVKIVSEKRGDTFGTRRNYAKVKDHFKKLALGLEYLLLEDKVMWLAEGHSSAWSYKVEQKGAREKKYAEQHLKGIEYRTIRLKLAAHRKLNQKITREYERGEISKQVFDEVILAASNINKRLSQQEQKQVDEILKKKWISYQKLAHDIRFLEDKTRHGIPLKGKCDLCRS